MCSDESKNLYFRGGGRATDRAANSSHRFFVTIIGAIRLLLYLIGAQFVAHCLNWLLNGLRKPCTLL